MNDQKKKIKEFELPYSIEYPVPRKTSPESLHESDSLERFANDVFEDKETAEEFLSKK